jgi:hypothetical protein
MRKLLIFAAWVGGIITHWLVGTTSHTRWLNEESSRQEQWQTAEYRRKYGTNIFVIANWTSYNTNFCVEVGTGTNRHPIEFGFREDGTVVWRKK